MDFFHIDDLTIYRSVYKYINSNMYILVEEDRALVFDPHEDIDAISLLGKVKKVIIVLTHEHTDHTSGIYWFQQRFPCKLICTKNCSDYISLEENRRPILISFILEEQDRLNGTNMLEEFKKQYVPQTYKADITFEGSLIEQWGSHRLDFFKVLGHSPGSCGIILDNKVAFMGDSLMKDLPIITRFPRGNKKVYISETLPFLENKLKKDMMIMPGHGDPFLFKDIVKGGKINVEFR